MPVSNRTHMQQIRAGFFTPSGQKQEEIERLLGFITNAGDPTGAVTPEFRGQMCHDTTNDALYWAYGFAPANWKKLSP